MAIQLNQKGLKNARARIRAGDIDSTSSWSFSAADGNKLLGEDNDDWANYAKWHLAEDTGANEETKARWAYPFGKNGKVYRSGLIAIRSRSAQQGHGSIFDAAGELIEMIDEKTEQKGSKNEGIQYRQSPEIRAVPDDNGEDQGIIEGYLTKWDTVDDYNSTFRRGAFRKTFNERKGKIRLIWNHEHLIGHVTEAYEDDYGPYVRGQINMETQAGKDAYAHVKAGDVDAFSFGFNILADRWKDGKQEILEVRCLEAGPVIFSANEQAAITGVRATDFDETLVKNQTMQKGEALLVSLLYTLDDIWWDMDDSEVPSAISTAIADFQSAYVSWAWEWIEMFKSAPIRSKLSEALYRACDGDCDELARTTSFTIEEIRKLRKGELLPTGARGKLAELPEEVRQAHQQQRAVTVNTLCDELRDGGGLTEAEKSRIEALLEKQEARGAAQPTDLGNIVTDLSKYREELISQDTRSENHG